MGECRNGSRSGLKIRWDLIPWGFKSLLAHHKWRVVIIGSRTVLKTVGPLGFRVQVPGSPPLILGVWQSRSNAGGCKPLVFGLRWFESISTHHISGNGVMVATPVLETGEPSSCRFKSCFPHHLINIIVKLWVEKQNLGYLELIGQKCQETRDIHYLKW